MRLITPEIIIDPEDPFKNDRLNRKPFAEQLTNLVTNVEDSLVISLDAQWGDGKTTFVKMWQHFLEQEEITTTYFDAFTHDYFGDPFVALVGNITALLKKAKRQKAKIEELKKKASKVGAQLLSFGARVGIKAATLGIIKDSDIDVLKGVAGDIASTTSDFASKIIEEKLNTYKEDTDAIEEFRNKLSQLAEEAFEEKKKPLVFIVDELDRCKPTYALELIEKIKHLFSVKHVVFVLVMHTQQLEEAVKCLYGRKIKARTYLQKFINVECKLPKDDKGDHGDDYGKYCRALSAAHKLDTENNDLGELMPLLARKMRLSLRDLERSYTNLVLFYSTGRTGMHGNDILVGFLSVLRVKRTDLFEALKTRTMPFQSLWEAIEFDQSFPTEKHDPGMDILRKCLRAFLLTDDEFTKLDENSDEKRFWPQTSQVRYGMQRGEILPYLCKQMETFKFPDSMA